MGVLSGSIKRVEKDLVWFRDAGVVVPPELFGAGWVDLSRCTVRHELGDGETPADIVRVVTLGADALAEVDGIGELGKGGAIGRLLVLRHGIVAVNGKRGAACDEFIAQLWAQTRHLADWLAIRIIAESRGKKVEDYYRAARAVFASEEVAGDGGSKSGDP